MMIGVNTEVWWHKRYADLKARFLALETEFEQAEEARDRAEENYLDLKDRYNKKREV